MAGWHDSRPDGGAHWISSHNCRRASIVVADGAVSGRRGRVPAGGRERGGGVLAPGRPGRPPPPAPPAPPAATWTAQGSWASVRPGCTERRRSRRRSSRRRSPRWRGRASWRRGCPRSGGRAAPPGRAAAPTARNSGRWPTSALLELGGPEVAGDGRRRTTPGPRPTPRRRRRSARPGRARRPTRRRRVRRCSATAAADAHRAVEHGRATRRASRPRARSPAEDVTGDAATRPSPGTARTSATAGPDRRRPGGRGCRRRPRR